MENMCPPLVPPGRSKQSDCGTPVPESPPPYPLFANICCGANGKFSPFVYGTVADADFGYLVKQQGGGGAKFIVQPQQQQQSQQQQQQPFASSSISATNGTSPFSHHQQQQQPLAVEGKKTCERPFLLKKQRLYLHAHSTRVFRPLPLWDLLFTTFAPAVICIALGMMCPDNVPFPSHPEKSSNRTSFFLASLSCSFTFTISLTEAYNPSTHHSLSSSLIAEAS